MELNLIKGKYERPAVAVLNGGNKRIEPNRNFCNKTRGSFFQCSGRVAETKDLLDCWGPDLINKVPNEF